MAKRKPRSAAQKAAARKLVAFNRSRRSGGAKKHRSASTRTRAVVMTSNPAPRPSAKRRRSTKRAATHAGRTLRFRRNPDARPSGGVAGLLKDAGLGAAGSIGVGFVVDKVLAMLPASIPRSPEVAAGVTLLGALGVSFLAAKAGKRAAGRALAVGAITVAADRMARIYIAKAQGTRLPVAPATVNGMELDYSMGEDFGEYVSMGEYNSMGEYVSN